MLATSGALSRRRVARGVDRSFAQNGVSTFSVIAFRKSRFGVIQYARDLAEKIYYYPRHLRRARYKAAVNAH